MDTIELIDVIAAGEDSRTQFKVNVTNQDSLASEIVAFSNAKGGRILVGVKVDGEVVGLSPEDIRRLNPLISDTASQTVKPSVNPTTENIHHPEGLVMVISIAEGFSKPYMDRTGAIWVKSGSDKRKATSREEIQRIYQAAGLLHADEVGANGLSIADLDVEAFSEFFKKEYGESADQQDISLEKLLNNMNLAQGEQLNIAGALLFARSVQYRLPMFLIKAVVYPGDDIHESAYVDSRDIVGTLPNVFQGAMSFLLANIRQVQHDQSVNSIGEYEIPRIVFEELVANALIHRDYFISAPIRLFVFRDRIELISPGHLPNNLTVDNIKAGNSNIRNPILASFATKLLPYRGLGNGIRRALKAYPHIEFEDDRDGNQFIVRIHRR